MTVLGLAAEVAFATPHRLWIASGKSSAMLQVNDSNTLATSSKKGMPE